MYFSLAVIFAFSVFFFHRWIFVLCWLISVEPVFHSVQQICKLQLLNLICWILDDGILFHVFDQNNHLPWIHTLLFKLFWTNFWPHQLVATENNKISDSWLMLLLGFFQQSRASWAHFQIKQFHDEMNYNCTVLLLGMLQSI